MADLRTEIFTTPDGRALEIRVCTPAEARLYPRFASRIASETSHTLHYPERPWTAEEVRARWSYALASEHMLYLGAFERSTDEDALVATVSVWKPSPEHPWIRHQAQFAVMALREYWGTGLARRLMLRMEEFARSIGVLRLEAQVRTENQRATRFYERLGYEVEGRRRAAALIDGAYRDEFHIAKILGASGPV